MLGLHNVKNALLSIAAADLCEVPIDKIADAIEKFTPSDMRQNISKIDGIIAIKDYYNASPESMKAAIETLTKINSNGKKIAVIGSMLELGEVSKKEHFAVGKFLAEKKIDVLFCYGKETKETFQAAKDFNCQKNFVTKFFENKKELISNLKEILKTNDVVLFKASRGMNFEKIFNSVFNYDKI